MRGVRFASRIDVIEGIPVKKSLMKVAAKIDFASDGNDAWRKLGTHKPTGKLSFTWPAAGTTDFQRGSAGYKTLYKFGHGLSW